MTLLGQNTAIPQQYAPQLLDPIARAEGRAVLAIADLPQLFKGEDVWHAWELGWLGADGAAQVGVGRFRLPATTPNLVESKSLKLYLHSLNHTRFDSIAQLQNIVAADLSAVAGAQVGVEILPLDSPQLAVSDLPGRCIDTLASNNFSAAPDVGLLRLLGGDGEQVWHSHLLRSLCPVTAQPDWASVVVWCQGAMLEPQSLLDYINSFRQHQAFHEQCVERIYCDLYKVCRPAQLSVLALYTRRGGLDINPWRSSHTGESPRLRTLRQ